MKNTKNIIAIAALITAMPLMAIAQGLPSDLPPPSAKPGQCFARVLVPAKYEQVPFTANVQDSYSTYEASEPVFSAPRDEVRVVQDAYTEYQVTAPKWRDVTETIVILPEHNRLVVNKPVFGAKTETFVIREPRFVWRPGANLSGVKRLDTNTGEVYCLVEERGVTETITRQVVKDKASVSVIKVPAQTATYNHKQLVEAAKVIEIPHAGISKNFQVRDLVKPANAVEAIAPGMTKTMYKQQLVENEHYAWVQVPCDTSKAQGNIVSLDNANAINETKALNQVTASDVQKRLGQLGFYRGPIDNIYGRMTTEAMRKFQASKGLPITGRADVESLKALGF